MKITFVKGSHCYDHVRVLKFSNYFKSRGIDHGFVCWLREKSFKSPYDNENYIFSGGGVGSSKLAFFYPLWMSKLFFHVLFNKYDKKNIFFVIDFDSALPVFLASFFNHDIKYIYDIHDDFSKRYKFPKLIKKTISSVDKYVRNSSLKTIHVDQSRVSNDDNNYLVIHNSPEDFFEDHYSSPDFPDDKVFCVSGLLTSRRGIESIYNFAIKNKNVSFIVAGNVIDDIARKFVELDNVKYLGVVKQKLLFEEIKNCHAVFSLYDPTVEINRLAASNKFYDAIMLGVPIIVNRGLIVSDFVEEEKIGFVIDYDFNDTWTDLIDFDNSIFLARGIRGRDLYERNFSYYTNFEKKLDGLLGLKNNVQK